MSAWNDWNAGRRGRALAAALAVVLLAASVATAQRRGGFDRGGYGRAAKLATLDDFDGSFQFCRIIFRNASNGDGNGWGVDWPRADENLSIRLSELTKTPVGFDAAGDPKPLLFRITQPELLHCPFVMMTEPGGAYFDDAEAAALRTYLLKGGFLWADDFWGEYAWDFWEGQIRKVLPSGPYPIVDLPMEHPIFHLLMTVPKIPQIPSIGFYLGTGRTSERGPDSAVPHIRAINDDRGRIMVLMSHNTDFGDAYEREGESHEYFERFSVPGYAFGINAIIYTLTH
jgi:hypothetical protein